MIQFQPKAKTLDVPTGLCSLILGSNILSVSFSEISEFETNLFAAAWCWLGLKGINHRVSELLQANKIGIQAWLFKYIKCLLCFGWPDGKFHIIAFYLAIPCSGNKLLENKVLIWCSFKKIMAKTDHFWRSVTKSSQKWGVWKSPPRHVLIDTVRLCRLPAGDSCRANPWRS